MEDQGTDHFYSTLVTSSKFANLPSTNPKNAKKFEVAEPNHGYDSDTCYARTGTGVQKPKEPISIGLDSQEDKMGGNDYTVSKYCMSSGSLNNKDYGDSGALEDESGKKTTFSESGNVSEDDGGGIEVGVMSMEAFYKVPKSMMILMLGIIGFLIVLILLLIIISAALIASTKIEVNDQKSKNEGLRAKIVAMEKKIQASCTVEDVDQMIARCDSSAQKMDGTIEGITSDLSNLTKRVVEQEDDIKRLQNITSNHTTLLTNLTTENEDTDFELSLLDKSMNIVINKVDSLEIKVVMLEEQIC